MTETKKEFEDTRDATDTGDLFLGGRVETKNVNATEDKSKFVKSPSTLSSSATSG